MQRSWNSGRAQFMTRLWWASCTAITPHHRPKPATHCFRPHRFPRRISRLWRTRRREDKARASGKATNMAMTRDVAMRTKPILRALTTHRHRDADAHGGGSNRPDVSMEDTSGSRGSPTSPPASGNGQARYCSYGKPRSHGSEPMSSMASATFSALSRSAFGSPSRYHQSPTASVDGANAGDNGFG